MSYERNKSDFQTALASMEDSIKDLTEVLSEDLLKVFQDVVDEYNNHFKDDLTELEDNCEEFKDKLNDMDML